MRYVGKSINISPEHFPPVKIILPFFLFLRFLLLLLLFLLHVFCVSGKPVGLQQSEKSAAFHDHIADSKTSLMYEVHLG